MSSEASDLVILVTSAAFVVLAVFLAWRGLQLRQLEPECRPLDWLRGTPSAIRLDHHFYSDWWVDFSIGSQPLRIVPGPWQGPAILVLRESKPVEVAFCPSYPRPRLWVLRQSGHTTLSVGSQQLHASGQARALFTGALLALCASGLGVLLVLRGRRAA